MTILFISLCLIFIGLFIFFSAGEQKNTALQKVRVRENQQEQQLQRIIDDISTN